MNTELEKNFGDRLISLSDGRPGLRTAVPITAHAPPSDAPRSDGAVLDFIASDETLDRYGEIISADGWKLDNYRRNPVFQNSHQYGDIIFTLGKALVTEIREVGRVSPSAPPRHALFQRIQFATDVNPMARVAHGLYRGGFLNAVSVGFVPLKWEDIPHEGLAAPERSVGGRRYLEQELLEVSSVAVPANPNALVLGLKSGAIEAGDLRELAELVSECLCVHRGRSALDGPQQNNFQPSTFNFQPLSSSSPVHPVPPARMVRPCCSLRAICGKSSRGISPESFRG